MIDGLVERWESFWFRPVPTSTIAVFRIVYGLLVFLWAVTMLPDAVAFFSDDGILRVFEVGEGQWTLLAINDSPAVAFALVALLAVAGACIALGYRARVATIIAFVILVSLRRRNPWVWNGGDSLVRHVSFFMIFAPSSAALSLDRWRSARDRFWDIPERAPWAQRLIQIQLSVLYLFTAWEKARGERWYEGTAVAESMRVGDLTRFHIPFAFSESLLVANLVTYGTIAVELALAVLVWNRRARPWVLVLGVLLHVFIEVTFELGFFSLIIVALYLTFVPEDTMAGVIDRVRTRLDTRRELRAALRTPARPDRARTLAKAKR